jgi:signal transduction histidine kinase
VVTLARRRKPRSGALFPGEPARDREYVELTVEDNGRGIDPGDLDSLFDPFFTTKENGTGLGLSIVHGIIKNHEGYLFVESEKNRGSRIGFALPA